MCHQQIMPLHVWGFVIAVILLHTTLLKCLVGQSNMQNISHKALDPPLNLKSYVMDNTELTSLGHKMSLN